MQFTARKENPSPLIPLPTRASRGEGENRWTLVTQGRRRETERRPWATRIEPPTGFEKGKPVTNEARRSYLSASNFPASFRPIILPRSFCHFLFANSAVPCFRFCVRSPCPPRLCWWIFTIRSTDY